MISGTHTHTVYWGEEQIAPLQQAAAALRIDYEERRPHIDAESRIEMAARLTILDSVIRMLGNRAQ